MPSPGLIAQQAFLGGRVRLVVGDLTEQSVDAIVNAANASLLGGGGVDGAIHRRGGPAILAACRELRRTAWPRGLPTGEAVITTGGDLPARNVIHTVGPVFGQHAGVEAALLAACYRNALRLAQAHALARVAFPAISTGTYGYPADRAAVVVSQTLAEALAGDDAIAEVRLVFFDARQRETFAAHQRFAAPG